MEETCINLIQNMVDMRSFGNMSTNVVIIIIKNSILLLNVLVQRSDDYYEWNVVSWGSVNH